MCLEKENIVRKLLFIAALICFSASALLIIWSVISKISFFEETYREYIVWLSEFEYKIGSINNKWLLLIVILLLYFIKTAFPFYPVSIICVASAMVFDAVSCFVINITGISILFAVRYITGKKAGGGNTQQLIRKNSFVRRLIENKGTGNPLLLFVFRLLPVFPVNLVSNLYGAMKFPFVRFIFISISGYLPKMASYIIIGRNVTNPFSLRFLVPLILLTGLTGTAFLIMREVMKINRER